MPASLHDVRAAIRDFNDAVMEAHEGPDHAAATELLLRCFGVGNHADARFDTLALTPSGAAAHPCGRLARAGAGAGPRSIALGQGLRLILPGAFTAEYKLVVCGDCVAIRLGFDELPPTVEVDGRYRDLAVLILASGCVALAHEAGTIELDVED